VRKVSQGQQDIVVLTSRRRNAAAQGHKRGDMFAKQMAHLFDKFDTDTGMATNQGIHANQDGTSDP